MQLKNDFSKNITGAPNIKIASVAPENIILGCEDIAKAKKCQKWLAKGKCTKLWAIKKCPKTCGECCEDSVKAKKCLKWKSKGKCTKNWVAKKCPKTCELCENGKNINNYNALFIYSFPKCKFK